MNFRELRKAYQGATLPQYVQHQMKSLDKKAIEKAMLATYETFVAKDRGTIDEYTFRYVFDKGWVGPQITSVDLAVLFDDAIEDIKAMATRDHVALSDEQVLNVFDLLVMRLTHVAHSNSTLRKMLGIKKGWFS